jgi:hypothetical protein
MNVALYVICRLIAVLGLLTVSAFEECRAASPAPPAVKLKVVILRIAYPEKNKTYGNPRLEQAFAEASTRIADYFHDKFGDSVKVMVRSGLRDTTADSIDRFFRDDWRTIADRSVTLLFILGHGELETYADDSTYGSDLRIVTSDTISPKSRAHMLLFDRDIAPHLLLLHPGSTVFTFLDTCHSAGAANAQLKLAGDVRADAGLKLMVLASSLPSDLALRSTFSQVLVDLWSEKGVAGSCASAAGSTEEIWKRMVARVTSDAEKGKVSAPYYVLGFQGDSCLTALAADRALLILYNPTGKPMKANIVQIDADQQPASGAEPLPPYPLERHSVTLLSVQPKRYSITVDTDPGNTIVDLSVGYSFTPVGAPPPETHSPGNSEYAAKMREGAEEAASAGFTHQAELLERQSNYLFATLSAAEAR